MVNLADIARGAGHGSGLEALTRQYGLDPGQSAKVIEALLPAFALAFQRMALNPAVFADFTRTLTSGNYASYFDNPGQPNAAAQGAAVVEQLFRSPEAARQVAAQTAALTGVGVQVMQQLVPMIAATIVGGMFRTATVEGFAGLLRQWGDALKAASEQIDPPKPQDPWSAWQAAAGQMMGLHPAPAPKPAPMNALDAWVAMVGAMTGMASPATPVDVAPRQRIAPPPASASGPAPDEEGDADAPDEAPDTPRAPDGEPNPFEAMSQMFETGREVHAQHLAAFQSILDNVWGPDQKA